MADDITLTVRVRDLTQGDFNRMRQRMRAMDGDIRRVAQSSGLASERARRLGQEIQGVSGRMTQLSRTGRLAGHELQFMRRTMGMLGRDLRLAARSGELSRDEFRALSNQLDETRLGFDRLTRDVERHNAVSQRAARDAERRQQQTQRMGQLQARAQREDEDRLLRMGRLQAAALRMDEQRTAAIRRQAEARARAAAAAMAALQRQQQQSLRQDTGRLAGLSGADAGLAARFRGMGDRDSRGMARSMAALARALDGVSGSSGRARRNVGALNQDLRTMSQILQNAQRDGNLTRREFNALSNGLTSVRRSARQLWRSGDLSRAAFRGMRREVSLLRAHLSVLGREGNSVDRLGRRMFLLGSHIRTTNSHAGVLRRTMGSMGGFGARGMGAALVGLAALGSGVRAVAARFAGLTRIMKIFIVVLALLGPIAQAAGALLVAALGGAFIALGAVALKGSASVKKAFTEMKNSVAFDVREAAKPMEGFLVSGLDQVAKSVTKLRPALESAFKATGPLIEDFFGGFTDMAARAMPGIVRSLRSMGPAMQGFRAGMGELGEGLGAMFDAMTKNGGAEALGRVWITLGKEMANLLVNIGEFINMAAKSETATVLFVGVFRAFSGALHVVETGLRILDPLFSLIIDHAVTFADAMSGASGIGNAFSTAGKDASELQSQLKAVNTQIEQTKKLREDINNAKMPKKMKEDRLGVVDDQLTGLYTKRAEITAAIAEAEATAANSTYRHAEAVERLKRSIDDLNGKNLNRFDAQAAMERSIDEAIAKAKELKGKVTFNNGFLNLDTKAGQDAQAILGGIARNTREYVEALEAAHAPQSEINEAWKRGRESILGMAGPLEVTKADLEAYADMVLATPESVKTRLEVEKKQAEENVESLRTRLGKVHGATAKAQTEVSIFRAMERLSMVETALHGLNGQTATTYVNTVYTKEYQTFRQGERDSINNGGHGATGGLFTASGFTKRGYADGGRVFGPGTGTSDSVFAPWLSNGEFVINARQTRKFLPLIDAINKDKLNVRGFASGGKVDKDARRELSSSFGINWFGRLAGWKTTPFERKLARPDNMNDLVGFINQTLTTIKKAFSGGWEKYLVKKMNDSGKALIQQQQKLEKVNSSLEKAKDKLDDLKQSAESLRESVSSGVVASLGITRASTGDKVAQLSDVMAMMRQNRDKATAFSGALSTLKERGFSGEIIQQIAEAGIEGGGLETATALMNASASEIGTLNSWQAEIKQSADEAGKTAADAMYGAGIKAAEGLVKGLTAQKAAIEKAMLNIAKSMEAAIKKALGIRSPSRVMQEVGHHTAEGFVIGMEKNRNVDTAWASMLNVKAASSGVPASSRGGGEQYVFPIHVGGKEVDEIWLDTARRVVRTRGGNVQQILGRRTS